MARRAKGEGSLTQTTTGWRGYATHSGKRYYVSGKTKAEASLKLKTLVHQLGKGKTPTRDTFTVSTWLDHWMKTTETDRKPSTNAGYRQSIDKYLKPTVGHVKLSKLRIEHVELAYTELRGRGLSGSTMHQAHSILRVALKQAVWRGHLEQNVAALVKPPTPDRSNATALSEEDLGALYAALTGDPLRARWHLSLDIGLRPGEAIALEWKHVDFTNSTITVDQQILQVRGRGAILQESTKFGGGRRTLSAPAHIMEMLKARRAQQQLDMIESGDSWTSWEPDGKPHAWCFTRKDGAVLRPGYDTQLWKKLLERAGLPHVKRYTSRHTAASMAISEGSDIAAVAEMMGHSNPNITLAVYTHAIEERKLALSASAGARFTRLTADKGA